MLRLNARTTFVLAIAAACGVLAACSFLVDTNDLSGGTAAPSDSGASDSTVADSTSTDAGSDADEEAEATIDAPADTADTATDAPIDSGTTDQGVDGGTTHAPVVTVSGTVASGTVTVQVAGKFRLVFSQLNGWQPTNWYDLAADPGATQDLANKSNTDTDPFLVDPAATQDTASAWLGPQDGTSPSLSIVESGPARAVLKTEYTLNQATPPDSGLPCKTALITTVYNIYASGRIGVDSSLTNEDTVTCTVDNFLFGQVCVEPSVDWSSATYQVRYGYSFVRSSGPSPRSAILAVAHNPAAGLGFNIDNDGPYNEFFNFGYSTIGAKGAQFDRYEIHLLDDPTPTELADRVNDVRNPALTVVAGATPNSSNGFDNNQGAYDVTATATTISFYPSNVYTRYAPAFVIESWTSPTYSISLGGNVIATSTNPDGANTIAAFDSANKRLVFTYLGNVATSDATAARTFTITP